MAMGIKQTHVAGSHVNMEFMANLAKECNAPDSVVEEIRKANTARHVSEIVNKHGITGFFDVVCEKVYKQMVSHAGTAIEIKVILFEFDGGVVGRYPLA
jgi:cobalt-precorrin-5B (C1)-methyltransferase